MKKLITGFLILFLCVLSSTFISAQNDEPNQKFMVWELQLSPTQVDQVMKAVKAQKEFFTKTGHPISNLNQMTNEGYYWYSIPFTKYAELDEIYAIYDKLWKDHPEEMTEIMEQMKGSFNTIGKFALELLPEISVLPESQPALSGIRFRVYERFYIKPGMEEDFKKFTKEYVALRKKHGIDAYLYTLVPDFGSDLSVFYFVDELGENQADHYIRNMEFWEKAGEDGEKLWKKVAPLVNRMETFYGQVNYDISYFPQSK